MIIYMPYVLLALGCLFMWGFLYIMTLLSRFGDDLTLMSEIIAAAIAATPVIIFLLWFFNIVIFNF